MGSGFVKVGTSVDEARDGLCADGWTLIGTGARSWADASPDGRTAARVTPWDPAYRLHADFTQDQLQAFLTIPVFLPGAETQSLLSNLADLSKTLEI